MAERGFALAETLVGSALVASVIAGCLSVLAHHSRQTAELHETVGANRSLRNAESLLRAGLSIEQVERELLHVEVTRIQIQGPLETKSGEFVVHGTDGQRFILRFRSNVDGG